MKGYCVRCRKSVIIENLKNVTFKNKRKAAQGYCPECRTKVTRFI